MARSNTGAMANWLQYSGAVVAAAPLSISCWFNPANTTAYHNLVVINNGGLFYFALAADGTAGGDPVKALTADGGGEVGASSSAGFSANVWNHGCAVFVAADSRAAYLNGANKGINGNTRTPVALNTTTIGTYNDGANRFSPLNGSVMEVGVWNVALSDDDVASLATGVSPLMVRPTSLVAYWPIIGRASPEIDIKSRFEMTENGTMANADHGRIIYPADILPGFAITSIGPVVVLQQQNMDGTGRPPNP